jgi:hypothetical protein
MKNPVLMIGILLFIIFILDLRNRKGEKALSWLSSEKYNTFACNGAIPKLEKHAPEHWNIACEKNNLAVEIKEQDTKLASLQERIKIQTSAYRQLANTFSFISKHSAREPLERIDIIRVRYSLVNLELNAISEGKDVFQFINAKDSKALASLLQKTVQVQEVWK